MKNTEKVVSESKKKISQKGNGKRKGKNHWLYIVCDEDREDIVVQTKSG